MKITKGSIYTAHGFDDGVRILCNGYFHFQILGQSTEWCSITSDYITLYLGIKIGNGLVNSNRDMYNHCFWFDSNGVHDSGIRFELKRKIKKNLQIV